MITRVDPSSKDVLLPGSQSVESETETVTVGALASGATYKFQVMVITTEGESSLSNPVTAATNFQETELQQFRKSLNLNRIENDLSRMNRKQSTAERRISAAENRLDAAERSGSWCAYQDKWSSSSDGVITYNRLMHVDTNLNRNALNTRTGEN